MGTNLKKFTLVFVVVIFFTEIIDKKAFSQSCTNHITFNPSEFSWTQFPEFSLPFSIVYSGSQQFDQPELLLKRGFTHISNPNGLGRVADHQKAFIYYGVASSNEPWGKYKSPWGNNMDVYHQKWANDLSYYQSISGGNLNYGVFCLDIEAQHKSRDSILALRNVAFTPEDIKKLSDDDMVNRYYQDMQALYAYAAQYIKNRVNAEVFTSYGDVPIFNTFTNIKGPSWDRWKSDVSLINTTTFDYANNKVGGTFYEQMDVLSPNAYFYYDYPHLFAGEYLSYLMFQIEANAAWSAKDQLVFLWNKYSYTPQFVGKNIQTFMSEAMAIFPFFAGAKGLYLWEDITGTPSKENYAYFINGLYRLSQFKHYFEGNYQLIHTISARDYNDYKMPIWRGVLKNGKMLVAAHNPWASSATEKVDLNLNYGSLNRTISLTGYEVFLCEFDVDAVLGNENNRTELGVYPNPNHGDFNYSVSGLSAGNYELKLLDEFGRSVYSEAISVPKEGEYEGQIHYSSQALQRYYLQIKGPGMQISKPVLIYP